MEANLHVRIANCSHNTAEFVLQALGSGLDCMFLFLMNRCKCSIKLPQVEEDDLTASEFADS